MDGGIEIMTWAPILIIAGLIIALAWWQDRKNMGCTSGLVGLAMAMGLTAVYRVIGGYLEGRVLLLFTLVTVILEITLIGFFATFAVQQGGRQVYDGQGGGVGMVAGAWTGLGIGIILSPISMAYLFLAPLLGLGLGMLFGAAAKSRKHRLAA